MSTADLEELLAILDLDRVDNGTFVGSHPSKNPVRTFGGQMMAQSFVAAGSTLNHDLAPSALSAHFIAGGDPAKDLEFHVIALRDERRFANRRVDVMQDGGTADHGDDLVHERRFLASSTASSRPTWRIRCRYRPSTSSCVDTRTWSRTSSTRCGRSIWRYTNDPTLGDARQRGAAGLQPGVDEGPEARCPTIRWCPRCRAGVFVGYHRARLDHQHARAVVGLRPVSSPSL